MLLAIAAVTSDLARQYPSGQEPARGGQDLDKQYVAGKELAHNGNQHLGHVYQDLAR